MNHFSKTLLLFVVLTACGSGGKSEGIIEEPQSSNPVDNLSFIDPSDSNIIYTGRWNLNDASQPRITWSGATVTIKFKGTRLNASLENEVGVDQFRIVIDGEANTDVLTVSTGIKTYILAEGLLDGEHTVVVMKETFYNQVAIIHGFYSDGELLPSENRPVLRLAFFGDSNMDGSSNYSEKNEGDSGSYFAYPAMTSRMLDAEMHLQAVGGAKLDENGDNDVRSFIYSPDYYNQDRNYRSGFEPHVIVVNAGANDLGVGKAEIKERFENVVSDLRNVYGDVPHIILMNAYGWDVNEPANYSQEIMDELGGNLSVLHFPWLWEQWHGSQWDHSGQAHMLANHIASLDEAWSIKYSNDIIDGFGRNGDFANGGFEYQAPFGGYGWRYKDNGVELIKNEAQASEGQYYIRLAEGTEVHQPTDATADLNPGMTNGTEIYNITAKIRGIDVNSIAQISTHFEGQQLYTHADDITSYQTSDFNLTTQWQEYSHTAQANEGVWTIFNYIRAKNGTIEVDDVKMTFSQ